MTKTKPPVMYQGGKSRFADRILAVMDVGPGDVYVEPFVGMGAVYLRLRDSGWRGRAILNDANVAVADVWRCLHNADLSEALAVAVEATSAWPRTNANHATVGRTTPPADPVLRAATWIWLQEGSFGGLPIGCDGMKYVAKGCGFDYATTIRQRGGSSNKHEPERNASIVRTLGKLLAGQDTEVLCGEATAVPRSRAKWYLDPPYVSTSKYHVGEAPFTWGWARGLPGKVFVSEGSGPPEGAGWSAVHLGDRGKTQRGNKDTQNLNEYLFVYEATSLRLGRWR